MKPHDITITDIADRLGITHSTVSRALSPDKGRPRMSAETRERIVQTAKELGYRPNGLARDLVRRRTFTVGVIVRHFNDPFYSDMIQELHVRFVQKNYLGIFFSARNLDEFQHAVKSLTSRRVEGIISVALDPEERQHMAQINVPIVYYGTLDHTETWVGPDAKRGTILALEHLIELGHRKIGYIGQVDPQNRRYRGFQQVLRTENLPRSDHWIQQVDAMRPRLSVSGIMQTGYDAMRRLLGHNDRPTATLCQNDVMAIGAERAILASGLRVPEDMALIGFDGLAMGEHATVPLTSVDPGLDGVVEHLVDTLFQRIKAPKTTPPVQIPIESRLVIRESTIGCKTQTTDTDNRSRTA